MPRNYVDKDFERERLVHHYIRALDQGDADGIAVVLEAALDDPELDRIIEEIHLSSQEELRLPSTATDAEIVRELVHKHLPSAFEEQEVENKPLTIGEVAARLKANRNVLPVDEKTNNFLLGSSDTLPIKLRLQDIKNLAEQFGVQASDRYWRNFRDTAITLGMARGQSNAQLVAAREERNRRKTLKDKQNKSVQPPKDTNPD